MTINHRGFKYLVFAKIKDMSNVIEIPLTKGMFALIDEEDFELVSQHKWYLWVGETNNYAHSKRFKLIRMHRLIMGITDPKIKIDHRNRNGLDNRKENLRIATNSQNTCNKGPYKNRSSMFKGVYWDKKWRKWVVQITPPGKKIMHIGSFVNEKDAALAYNQAAKKYHGEFAYLNQIIPIE